MTSCNDLGPLLHAVLEGGNSEHEAVSVHAHLAQCEHCRKELEDERRLTLRLRRKPTVSKEQRAIAAPKAPRRWVGLASAGIAGLFLIALGANLWFPSIWLTRPAASTMMSCMLGPGLEWLPSSERELGEANHVSLPSGTRATLDIVDVGHINATGPVAFELDRTAAGWKLTLLHGALELDIIEKASLAFSCTRGISELQEGSWFLSSSGASRPQQDSISQLLVQANATFQERKDMLLAERQFKAILDHQDCRPYHRRVALYLLWVTQQRLEKHSDALANIDLWIEENANANGLSRALLHKGLILSQLQRPNEAIATWHELIAAHPDSAAAATARARILQLKPRAPAQSDPTQTETIENWARNCAIEIPWQFDRATAMEKSRNQKRPLLIYVRSIHQNGVLNAANESLAAPSVRIRDSGYAKDLLFRAAVLADSRVSATVRTHFEPLMVSYDFHTHGKGSHDSNWSARGQDAVSAVFDTEEGSAAAGSLVLTRKGSFLQSVVKPEHRLGDEFRFRAKVKTEGGATGVRVYWKARGSKQILGSTKIIHGETNWTELSYAFTPEKALVNVLIMPTMQGRGRAWFDDLELVRYRNGKPLGSNLLRNGGCDPNGGGADPLRAFGLRASEIVTPALLVVNKGKVTQRIHRIGAMNADHINEWLRQAVAAPIPVEPRAGALRDAWSKLSRAKWEEAAKLLEPVSARAGDTDREEAGFLRGLALHRLGRHEDATKQWQKVAGSSQHGRRAAACLLPAGPRLPQAISLRAWNAHPAKDSSEAAKNQEFDATQALEILLELQQPNGAFIDHLASPHGKQLQSFWGVAYAAIAGRALRSWRSQVNETRQQRIDVALSKIAPLLDAASRRKANRIGAFNDPYAIDYAIAIGAMETAQRFVERIVSAQLPDGTWTVYGPKRPTSFNTAQNLLGLLHARDAGLKVPQGAIAKAKIALARMRQANGRFSYAPLLGFKWMTTEEGGVAREPLCEHALLLAGNGSQEQLDAALDRFVELHGALRQPTKHYSSDFNKAGHGAYFFYYAYRNAADAAMHTDPERRARVHRVIAQAVLASRETDGSFVDHALFGRMYGTAMALSILGDIEEENR